MDDNVLDTSWMDDVKKEINIDTNYNKEPCEQMNTIFIFVDIENNIHKINSNKETVSIVDDKRIITKERLIQIIESKKREIPMIKYKLTDVLLYCNEIDTDNIRTYAKTENMDEISSNVLKVVSIFNDVIIPKSIFIFHSINALYFIFKQVKNKIYSNIPIVNVKVKSILKNKNKKKTAKSKQSGEHREHNITKKVAFQDECSQVPIESNLNMTKKNYDYENEDENEDKDKDNIDDSYNVNMEKMVDKVDNIVEGNAEHNNKHNKTRRL